MRKGLLALFVATIVIACIAPFKWPTPLVRLIAWLVVGGGVTAVALSLGPRGTRRLAVLLDERDRYSQPALITLAWCIVIVSAYLACAMWNLALWTPGSPQLPIAIDVPRSVWILAGVIGVDVVGTGIIVRSKRARGLVFARKGAAPDPIDFVAYDEPNAAERTDPAALQKLLFQIAAVTIYAIALGRLIVLTAVDAPILGFPSIPEGFLTLLGVSTGIALANRSIPRG